jgi:sortase (surface protein transpeptidase)
MPPPVVGIMEVRRAWQLAELPLSAVLLRHANLGVTLSWFDRGPTPGQLGPAALLGHMDVAATGPAVFYRLRTLAPGDTVRVTRADHRVAVFRIYRIAASSKTLFPRVPCTARPAALSCG